MNLYALLIGIDDYAVPSHNLSGCLADVSAVNSFFEKYCQANQISYHPQIVTNEQATRKNLIQHFSHFKKVEEGDLCLLYFSGHGSQMPAPKEFWSIDINRKCQTIVCHDSRLQGGRDLANKEISFLIHENTKHVSDCFFLAIFDSCHSGAITRDVAITPRMQEENTLAIKFDDFLGVEFYNENNEPPVKSHIAFSAARSYESAIELKVNGQKRGLFTYSLLKAMADSNLSNLSYLELMNKTQIAVNSKYKSQHPVLNGWGNVSLNNLFFNGELKVNPTYTLSFSTEKFKWFIHQGEVNGIKSGDKIIALDENENEHILNVEKVESGVSYIEAETWMDFQTHYVVKKILSEKTKLKIAFHPNCKMTAAIMELKSTIVHSKIEIDFEITPNAEFAEYFINQTGRGLILTYHYEERPLFKAIPIDDEGAIIRFISNINKIAKWERVSQISNPNAPINLNKLIEVEFYEVTNHEGFRKIIEKKTQPLDGTAVFKYKKTEDGKEVKPTFGLSIKNKSATQALWIGGLFFDEQYGITAQLTPMKLIQPNEEKYFAKYFHKKSNYYYEIIPLTFSNILKEWGLTSIQNQFKLFVSTQEIFIDQYCQEPLELEPKNRMRGIDMESFDDDIEQPTIGWATLDISFSIERI